MTKTNENENGFSVVELLIVVGVLILIGVIAFTVNRQIDIRNSKKYFSFLNSRMTALDNNLVTNTKDKIDYDQANSCYHWNHTDFKNGPLGCIINRAYYFPASNENSALILNTAVEAAIKQVFTSPRYSYSGEKFVYDNYVYTPTGLEGVGQPAAGFTANGKMTDTQATKLQSYCFYQINWPNDNPYLNGKPFLSDGGLPARTNTNLLRLTLSCGADVTEAFYPVTND